MLNVFVITVVKVVVIIVIKRLETLEVMDMSRTLMVVMISRYHTCSQMHTLASMKHAQLLTCQRTSLKCYFITS